MSTYLRLLLGMMLFGSATPVSKLVTQAWPVFLGGLLRVVLGTAALAIIAVPHMRQLRQIDASDWVRIAFIALFGIFGFSAFMLYGMQQVSGVAGAIVMSTTPAVTAAGAVAFLGDRITWRKVAAVLCAVAGVLVLQLNSGRGESGADHQWLGIALVFGAVCCEAAYTLLGKKVSDRVDPLLVAFLGAALSIPVFVPFAGWQWPQVHWQSVDGGAWSAVAWYGIGTLALGSWLWYSGLKKTQGAIAAGFMGVMPASALLLSYVLLDEHFEWLHMVGFAIVIAGVVLIAFEHARGKDARTHH